MIMVFFMVIPFVWFFFLHALYGFLAVDLDHIHQPQGFRRLLPCGISSTQTSFSPPTQMNRSVLDIPDIGASAHRMDLLTGLAIRTSFPPAICLTNHTGENGGDHRRRPLPPRHARRAVSRIRISIRATTFFRAFRFLDLICILICSYHKFHKDRHHGVDDKTTWSICSLTPSVHHSADGSVSHYIYSGNSRHVICARRHIHNTPPVAPMIYFRPICCHQPSR